MDRREGSVVTERGEEWDHKDASKLYRPSWALRTNMRALNYIHAKKGSNTSTTHLHLAKAATCISRQYRPILWLDENFQKFNLTIVLDITLKLVFSVIKMENGNVTQSWPSWVGRPTSFNLLCGSTMSPSTTWLWITSLHRSIFAGWLNKIRMIKKWTSILCNDVISGTKSFCM